MTQGRTLNLDILRVQGYRFFCNKLWNAVKFASMYFTDDFKNSSTSNHADKLTVNPTSLSLLLKTIGDCGNLEKVCSNILDKYSYLNGYEVSGCDFFVSAVASKSKWNTSGCPHLNRWFRHINNITPKGLFQVLGNESPLDLWMLSRLSAAVQMCNDALEAYDFVSATTACYNLWLYDLCDVYLESLKPVFASGDKLSILAAQNTLYYTLNTGLRLLSPFMPFITEELYQRLPHGKRERAPSICVAKYPEQEEYLWRNVELELQVDFAQKLIHKIRSARSDYNIPRNSKTEAFFRASDDSTRELVNNFGSFITLLSSCSSLKSVDGPPDGSAILPISDKCEVFLVLKGMIDPLKEIQKLEKKKEFLVQSISKLETAMSSKDYEAKVPEEIRFVNQEKLVQNKGELDKLAEALEVLAKL
uniref:valine--tRNA ligase n=4 Tax=Lygus hesperus TaxID=30085 RepID=A0A0K8T843_LYGHE